MDNTLLHTYHYHVRLYLGKTNTIWLVSLTLSLIKSLFEWILKLVMNMEANAKSTRGMLDGGIHTCMYVQSRLAKHYGFLYLLKICL